MCRTGAATGGPVSLQTHRAHEPLETGQPAGPCRVVDQTRSKPVLASSEAQLGGETHQSVDVSFTGSSQSLVDELVAGIHLGWG